MKKLVLIGDVHGYVGNYKEIIDSIGDVKSIQLGDFGFESENEWFIREIDPNQHKILFGNHDYYPYLDNNYSLGNFGYLEEYGIFYIRGAYSIDKSNRIPGYSWFENEELNYMECNACLDLYEKCKPELVISHDCPELIQKDMFGYTYLYNSTTTKLLDAIYNIHQPKNWFFGHHHSSVRYKFVNTITNKITEFRCLNELEQCELHLNI